MPLPCCDTRRPPAEQGLQLTIARADGSGRLRIGRLGVPLAAADSAHGLALWPHRWADGVVVLGRQRWATPHRLHPALLTGGARLRLPAELCAHLDAGRRPLLLAADGQEVWLVTASRVAQLLC
jgi:hypothetical protein